MAFTIRKLSKVAEINLEKLQKRESINTNTKAIEFVLENFPRYVELSKSNQKTIYELQSELNDKNKKLDKIGNAFNLIKEISKP
jgi:hypothetical protein